MICKGCEEEIDRDRYESSGLCGDCELGCSKEDESGAVHHTIGRRENENYNLIQPSGNNY